MRGDSRSVSLRAWLCPHDAAGAGQAGTTGVDTERFPHPLIVVMGTQAQR